MIRLLLLLLVISSPVAAVEPDEILTNPALELRARDISENLRCVVCQNETIDSSNSGVARDLRLLVRERLVAGDTDDEVYAYIVARYGDYVLFNPPWKPSTYALWLAPFVAAFMGLFLVAGILRRASRTSERQALPLTAIEQAVLADATERHNERDADA